MTDLVLSAEALALISTPDNIERHRIADEKVWHDLRARDVTASQIGAVLKEHEYTSLWDLWRLKSGRATADQDETPAMRRGRLFEPVAFQMLREDRPDWRVSPLGNTFYFRDPIKRIGCTPDGFAIRPDRPGFGVIQVKTTSDMVWRKKWRPEEFGAEPNVPTWIGLQALTEMKLTGASWASIVVLVAGHGVDLYVVDVPDLDGVWDVVTGHVADFWRLVESGHTPDPDFERDAKQVVEHFAEKTGETIDLSADNRIIELVEQREALKLREKDGAEAEKARKIVDAEIIAKMGHASRATIADGRAISVSTITVNRKPAPASTYTYPKIGVSGVPSQPSTTTKSSSSPEKF